VHAPQYHETLFSHLYPGKQDCGSVYQPVLKTLAASLAFTDVQKQATIVRSDAGFGGDANINFALGAGWQVLAKGKGGRRPQRAARCVDPTTWMAMGKERWLAPMPQPPLYDQPTQHLVLRWQTSKGLLKYATLVCSILEWSMDEVLAHYDDRGACETEIQADKRGLQLERRRKKHLAAQEALILLTDVAHNLLAWTTYWMFPTGPYANFGFLRFTQDILTLPGHLCFENDHLVEVQLNERHPHARPVASALARLLDHFGNP
jgi:hypothetical protein